MADLARIEALVAELEEAKAADRPSKLEELKAAIAQAKASGGNPKGAAGLAPSDTASTVGQ